MEQKKRMILAGLTILALVAVTCAGTAAYCHYSNDGQQTDDGYSVEFYPADGTTTITLGTSVSVTSPTGEHFDHWNTQADNKGKSYAGGETVSLSAASPSLTLYAIYSYNTYTINFDANGGTGTMDSMSMTYDTAKNLTANEFTKEGYKFLGWSEDSTATKATYTDKELVNDNLTSENNGKVTLYAIWGVNQYTATMKLDGGTATGVNESWTVSDGGHSYSKDFDYGTSVADIISDFNVTPVKNNHDFSSWSPSTGTLGTSGITITANYNNHTYSVDRTAHVGEFTTISDDSNATATYGTDYTFTLGVTYTTNDTTVTSNVTASNVKFTVTIGNTDYTDDCISNENGSYTIKGADITGDITISTTAINCFSLAYCNSDGSGIVTYQYYSYDSNHEFKALTYSEVYDHRIGLDLWGYGTKVWYGWTDVIWAGQSITLSAGELRTLTHIPLMPKT